MLPKKLSYKALVFKPKLAKRYRLHHNSVSQITEHNNHSQKTMLVIDYCFERKPGTVTNLLNDLNWHSLELRRKIARLTTMYKMVN